MTESAQAAREAQITSHAKMANDVDSLIVGVEYFTDPAGGTICNMTLQSGFIVSGHTRCADSDDGQALANTDALNQLWQMEMYARADRLFRMSVGGEA